MRLSKSGRYDDRGMTGTDGENQRSRFRLSCQPSIRISWMVSDTAGYRYDFKRWYEHNTDNDTRTWLSIYGRNLWAPNVSTTERSIDETSIRKSWLSASSSFPVPIVIPGSIVDCVCSSCNDPAVLFLTFFPLFLPWIPPPMYYRRWLFAQGAQQFLVNQPAGSADLPKVARLERRWIEHQITLYNCK